MPPWAAPPPGYAPPTGYAPPPGYAPPTGYAPPPGYAPPTGYAPPPPVARGTFSGHNPYLAAPGAQPGPYSAYGVDPNARSRTAAGLLGIFLGGFGAHRFYLGYTGIGILQIVVTVLTCGVGSLWGLVEGILILAGSSSFRTDAQGRPLRD